jgi:hypothetical protein
MKVICRTVAAVLLPALIFSGCKKTSQYTPSVGAPPASAPSPLAQQLANPEGGVTVATEIKYFTGSIGNALGLQMKLVREGGNLTGSYFYQKVGTKIDLKGSIDGNGNLTLEEFTADGTQTGIFKGLWTANSEDGMVDLAGNWTKPDGQKKTAFSLHEQPIYFSGGGDIVPRTIKETNPKLKFEISGEYPQLSGILSSGIEKFNQEASRVAVQQVTEFKKNMAEPAEDDADSNLPNSTLDISYTVSFATDELISIDYDVGTYYRGAAHPNSQSISLNFDVKNSKSLKLADLFKPGSKYLQALSAYAIKDLKQQSKAKNGVLDDESIQNGAGPTAKNYDSWTITKKGLSITFDAYQVGPYVAGPQYVLIPYSALKDLIEPSGPIAGFVK